MLIQAMTVAAAVLGGFAGRGDHERVPARAWDGVESVRVVTIGWGDDPDGERGELRADLRVAQGGDLYLDWAHGNEETWQQDPTRNVLSIRKDWVSKEVPYRRVVVKYPLTATTHKADLSKLAIFAVLGWWPRGMAMECPRVHDRPTGLQYVADDPDYRLISEGGELLVLRSDVEEIGLSREHGLAIRYRTWRSRETGRLLSSMYVDGFRELALGVWFPESYRVLRHNPDDPAEARTVQYRVLEASVNDARPSDFDLGYPPGTYLLDADGGGGGKQLSPGGFEMMEAQVQMIRGMDRRGGWPDGESVLGGLAGVAAYLLGAAGLRRHRK